MFVRSLDSTIEEEGPERLLDNIDEDEEEEGSYRFDFCPPRVEEVAIESVSEVEWDMQTGYAAVIAVCLREEGREML